MGEAGNITRDQDSEELRRVVAIVRGQWSYRPHGYGSVFGYVENYPGIFVIVVWLKVTGTRPVERVPGVCAHYVIMPTVDTHGEIKIVLQTCAYRQPLTSRRGGTVILSTVAPCPYYRFRHIGAVQRDKIFLECCCIANTQIPAGRYGQSGDGAEAVPVLAGGGGDRMPRGPNQVGGAESLGIVRPPSPNKRFPVPSPVKVWLVLAALRW